MTDHTVVLVTGSMRSGTSSLAGSLKLLGWHVPQPEVPASERNAKGHFEPRWVIEFHKRLMRGALVRPSDGSPRAEERVAALLEDGARRGGAARLAGRAGRAAGRRQGPARRLGAADCGAAPPSAAGRDLRMLTALRHPAEVVGSQDLTWGEGRRTDAERRVKETSNTAAWLNVALVTERGLAGRAAGVPPVRRPARPTGARRSAGSPTSSTSPCRSTRTAALDDVPRPGHAPLPADLGRPRAARWLRDLAEDTWQQLGALVDDPARRRGPRPGSTPPGRVRRPLRRGASPSPSTRPGTASAAAPRQARPSSGAGSRPSGRGARRPRPGSTEPGQGQSTKRALGQIARQVAVGEPGRHELVGRAGSARPPHAPSPRAARPSGATR